MYFLHKYNSLHSTALLTISVSISPAVFFWKLVATPHLKSTSCSPHFIHSMDSSWNCSTRRVASVTGLGNLPKRISGRRAGTRKVTSTQPFPMSINRSADTFTRRIIATVRFRLTTCAIRQSLSLFTLSLRVFSDAIPFFISSNFSGLGLILVKYESSCFRRYSCKCSEYFKDSWSLGIL